MTASSFSSLSLEPPLVLVSVDQRARLHRLLPEAGRYGVSILARGQEGLSSHFAGRSSIDQTIPWIEAEGLPFLDGALAHLACDVFNAVPGGDHIIYIGRITHAESLAGARTTAVSQRKVRNPLNGLESYGANPRNHDR